MRSPFIHFFIALALVIVVGSVYGSISYTVSSKNDEAITLQKQIVDADKDTGRAVSARTVLAEIANDEAAIRGYFVQETEVATFITDLEERATTQHTSVNVSNVSTGGTATSTTLSVALSMEGTFDSVLRTVGAIEYAPYALSISKLAIEQNDKNIWHVDLTLSVGSVGKVNK